MKTEHYKAFNEQWFAKHQHTLLWFLNAPVIKYLARWIMRIRKFDHPINEKIYGIFPNRFVKSLKVISKEEIQLTVDFRTHPKFSKRVYYAFKPLWWALHYWDEVFADRYAPQVSFGFSVLTAYPDPHPETSTVDGYVSHDVASDTFSNIRNGVGTDFDDTNSSATVIRIKADAASNMWELVRRSIFLFDTAAVVDDATISSAVLSLCGSFVSTDSLSCSPDIDIYTSAPASNTTLAAGDFDSLGTTSQTGSPIGYSSWNTSSYNDFTFNATGISNISKTGISKFGARNANYDVANVAPTWSSSAGSHMYCYFADEAGTTSDPKLVVTYSTTSIKVVNGLAIASVKNVDGLAVASVKNINGLA